MWDVFTLVEALWLIIPAYAANGLAPLARGKRHIDGGRMIGKSRILGEGKTWEGLILGCVAGAVIGLVEMLAFPYLPWSVSPVILVLAPMGPLLGFALGLGAMVGDLFGAFIKRRAGIPKGCPAPLLDQEDFIIGSLVFASFVTMVQLEWFVMLFVITPAIHLFANMIGYVLHVKKEPW